MSFRLRLFLLVMLVAIVSVGATTWLTLTLASRQIDETTARANRDVVDISNALKQYALAHGTWIGVSDRVAALSTGYQQRIRLVTLDGTVLVDSDQLAGRTDRPAVSPPTLIDPRPRPTFPPAIAPMLKDPRMVGLTTKEIAKYRATVTLTQCATANGYQGPLSVPEDSLGVPDAGASPNLPALDDFCGSPKQPVAELANDQRAVEACYPVAVGKQPACLERVFAERTDIFAPPPIQMFLGGVDAPAPVIDRTTLGAAGGVMVLIVVGTALVARRVSKPIRALTTASRQLAGGRLDARVPARGADELGQLSRSFNRMAEALQQAEEDQRRLVASVAHELRTPLSNLRGYLEALQDGVLAPSPELFASLSEEVLLQRRILDDLQDLALAEAGDLMYHRRTIDLADLVAISRFAHLAVAEEAGVELRADVTAPLMVVADHDRLRQTFGNLITNALRYTDAGGTVLLRARSVDGSAVVEVIDTGCGIAATDLRYVFRRFWRADPARDRSTGGSGLGLTIAQRIAIDHGGDITVRSAVGAGSCFTVKLPLASP